MQLPFMTRVRETLFPELKNGAPLEPHVAAVPWCDGDIAQIKTIIKLRNIEYDDFFTIGNNQSASRSVVE